MALNAVVLPAPFGPMTLVIDPGRTANDTPSRAVPPPKLTARSLTERVIGAGPVSPEPIGGGPRKTRLFEARSRAAGRTRAGRGAARRRASATATTRPRAGPRAAP